MARVESFENDSKGYFRKWKIMVVEVVTELLDQNNSLRELVHDMADWIYECEHSRICADWNGENCDCGAGKLLERARGYKWSERL